MGPVFLFHVGVIILVVRPAAGESDRRFSLGKMSQQVVIEELGAVIAIEAQKGEGQHLLQVIDLLQDTHFSLTPDGPLFGPAGGNVDEIQGISELAG